MDTPFTPAAALRLDESGRLVEDIACLRCGYNLRGLDPNGVCPECGTAIGQSTHGDLLRFCDPAWVLTLHSGMSWIIGGIAFSILSAFVVGAVAASGGAGQAATIAITFLGQLITIVAYWKLTAPDPSRSGMDEGFDVRQLVRVTVIAGFVLALLQQIIGELGRIPLTIVSIASGIVGIITFFAIFIYVRRLALRIPDEQLAARTRLVMWGIVVLSGLASIFGLARVFLAAGAANTPPGGGAGTAIAGVGFITCFVGIGFVVFAVMALFLVFRYKKAFKQAAEFASQTWASGSASAPAFATNAPPTSPRE